jgi:uncharacterized protein YjbI with pentapeptide repeats
MREQQSQATATAVQVTSKCPHPEAVGTRWGDPISEERQAELQRYLKKLNADFRRGLSDARLHFRVTGADTFWLAERLRDERGFVSTLHLERADLEDAHLEGANLAGIHLEEANLNGAHLAGAVLFKGHLEAVNMSGADLTYAHMVGIHLDGANLLNTRLNNAQLKAACLAGTDLRLAHLEGADLQGAHLEGKILGDEDYENLREMSSYSASATLPPADLRGAYFDAGTILNGIHLSSKIGAGNSSRSGSALVADVRWGGVNLAVIDWSNIDELGDERDARKNRPLYNYYSPVGSDLVELESIAALHPFRNVRVVVDDGPAPNRAIPQNHTKAQIMEQQLYRLEALGAAVRANRQLAMALRGQGLTEVADRFAYRAQVLQRKVLRRKGLRGWVAFLGSWFLDRISGYGYKPMRSFITYIIVVLGFAAAYLALGGSNGQPLTWNESLVVSMTAFHGRGFFSSVFQPGDLQAAVAAVEAFIGLLIEIVFIATFTQRFFAR